MVPWNLSGCAWCVTKCKQVRKLVHIQFKTGYYANTKFTSTEFTPTYVSQKVKGEMNSLNYVSDLAHDHLNVLDSNETTSTHSWHLKQWDHGSINLQWDLMQLWTNTKHVRINQWRYQLWARRVKANVLPNALNKNKLKLNLGCDTFDWIRWIEKHSSNAKKD